jgi:hypothetical protein
MPHAPPPSRWITFQNHNPTRDGEDSAALQVLEITVLGAGACGRGVGATKEKGLRDRGYKGCTGMSAPCGQQLASCAFPAWQGTGASA